MSLFKADKKSFQGLYPLPLGNLRHASADQVGFEKPIPGIRFQTKLSLLCSLPGWISCTGCLLYCTQHNVSGGEDDILKATRYQNRSALPRGLTLHHNSTHWEERKNLQAKGRQFSMDGQWAFQWKGLRFLKYSISTRPTHNSCMKSRQPKFNSNSS